MSFWKRLSYSVSLAIVLSALAVVFYKRGGEFVAIPGMILEGWTDLLILLVTNDAYLGFADRWMYFNIPIYTVAIYLASLAVSAMRNEKKASNLEIRHGRD